jgi:UDP-N-acetylmuramoyl-tripeptide--D-alanyl-D-alanine ligase|tara:strand:+ start:4534 stop:5916 length:1383 start_codon:yes stop_codon:yes gene_type:complete
VNESTLWRWEDLCLAVGVAAVEGPKISGFAIDSRRIRPGDLFIALPGDPGPRFQVSQRSDRDGHDYVAAAIEAGAAGALVHRPVDGGVGPLLRVDDTLDALWNIARARRAEFTGNVLAVTGSSGKTTTKTLLARALGAFATAGSLNNHLGVPLSIASTPLRAKYAVYEIGTNHPGEIEPLSQIARPDVAIVLNVHAAHAEFFRDRVELEIEKLSIYKGLGDKGHLIVEDTLALNSIPDAISVHRFGETPDALVQLLAVDERSARIRLGNDEFSAHVPGGGRHRALSLCAVLAAMSVLGEDPSDACQLTDELIPRGRGTHLEARGVTLIDDSYNANPESMAAAVTSLGPAAGRRLAVLGEMLELGNESDAYHRQLAGYCADLDMVVCVGEGMRVLHAILPREKQGPWFARAGAELLDWLSGKLTAGDLVLIKGSNRVFWTNDFVAQLAARLAGEPAREVSD